MAATNNQVLWYETPARVWEECLPIGNGEIGAMLGGGVDFEKIQFNHGSVWSGYVKDTTNPKAKDSLFEARNLIENGEYIKAGKLIERNMCGNYSQGYLPVGDLYLRYDTSGVISDYRRKLDLTTAISTVTFNESNDYEIKREYLISAVDNVLAIRISAAKGRTFGLCAHMDSELKSESSVDEQERYITLSGICPSHVEPQYVCDCKKPVLYDEEKETIRFQSLAKIVAKGGHCYAIGNKLHFYEATEICIYMTVGSSFVAFNKAPIGKIDLKPIVDAAVQKGFEKIKEAHVADYQKLYNRVTLDICSSLETANHTIPTNVRLSQLKEGYEDNTFAVLLFYYGRYLMISSSRIHSQATNLQGLWNKDIRPAWSSNMTTNINTQMNYWPTEVCNLHELHNPLINAIVDMSISGEKTARENYGMNGFVVHHNVDIWRMTTPSGGLPVWAFWPMAAPWLCRHIWEHYTFYPDTKYLSTIAYPIMKKAAEFLLDWTYIDKNGYLATSPSTSPENWFLTKNGERCSVSKSSTMDISLIRELFTNCIKAAEILGLEDNFVNSLYDAIVKLPPCKIGKHGQLLEWSEDFEESEIGHRHMSHLYGLYPGNEFIMGKDDELVQACRVSIDRRIGGGSGYTGWSCAWIINLFTRLKDSEMAFHFIQKFITQSTYINLLCSHPPFQIDGNFGFTAGIAEMLVQSHGEYIEILPALPVQWKNGCVKGLCTRGGFVIDIEWENNCVVKVNVLSLLGTPCRIKIGNQLASVDGFIGENNIFSFKTTAAKIYSFQK